MVCEDVRPAGALERDHLIVNGRRPFHSRRSGRHSGDCEPRDLRFSLEQLLNVSGGHVSFNDIATHHRGMTRCEGLRNSEILFYVIHLACVLCVHSEAVLPQVFHPLFAASAVRVFVNRDDRCGLGGGSRRRRFHWREQQGDTEK